MINFHAHIGLLNREGRPDRPNLNADSLIELMDQRGIDQAVLLTLESRASSSSVWDQRRCSMCPQ